MLTDSDYTITEARYDLRMFEREINAGYSPDRFGCRPLRDLMATLVDMDAVFTRCESRGWTQPVHAGHWWTAYFDMDVEIRGVPVVARAILMAGKSGGRVQRATVEIGARVGANLEFSATSDIPAVQAAQAAFGSCGYAVSA